MSQPQSILESPETESTNRSSTSTFPTFTPHESGRGHSDVSPSTSPLGYMSGTKPPNQPLISMTQGGNTPNNFSSPWENLPGARTEPLRNPFSENGVWNTPSCPPAGSFSGRNPFSSSVLSNGMWNTPPLGPAESTSHPKPSSSSVPLLQLPVPRTSDMSRLQRDWRRPMPSMIPSNKADLPHFHGSTRPWMGTRFSNSTGIVPPGLGFSSYPDLTDSIHAPTQRIHSLASSSTVHGSGTNTEHFVIKSENDNPNAFTALEHHSNNPNPSAADPFRVFHPMEAKKVSQNPDNQAVPRTVMYKRMIAGFSPNYRGNINLARNKSAAIADELNCSLFIVDLPKDVTTHELLGSIRGAGRVYATHINGPEPTKGHLNCAAKVIFFDRASAERLYSQVHAAGGFHIRGRPAGTEIGRIMWNRIRNAASDGPRHQSRVLLISGPGDIVNEQYLTAYFDDRLQFQIDEVIDRGSDPVSGRRLIEYRFGSYRCQAESAKMALGREFGDREVKVWFGRDPCDVAPQGATYNPASFAIEAGLFQNAGVEVGPSNLNSLDQGSMGYFLPSVAGTLQAD